MSRQNVKEINHIVADFWIAGEKTEVFIE